MSNIRGRTSHLTIVDSIAYAVGWADVVNGTDRLADMEAMRASLYAAGHKYAAAKYSLLKYQQGRLCALLARLAGRRLRAPTKANRALHAALLKSAEYETGDCPLSRAVTAKRAQYALMEIVGTIPPRTPMATLTFRRGLPVVPTFAEVTGHAPAAAPTTRRAKVPA